MFGLMQDWSLLIHRVIDHAAAQHGNRPVISRSVEGPMHRTTYAEVHRRARRVAKRLERDGIRLGDRVATLAWNTWRHLESWYGITGIGAIYHTVNPRLFEDQIVYIMNHAEDRVLMLDLTFVPLMERLQERLPTVERFIVLTDADHMPQTSLRNAVAYESWLAEADEDFALGEFRREHRRGPLLYVRHHGRAEGRALLAPFERAPRARQQQPGFPRPVVPRRGDARRAALPRQQLVLRLRGADGGRRPRPSRAETRRRVRASTARGVRRHRHGGRADRVAGAPAVPREHGRDAFDPQARGHRRLRLPAGDDGGVRDQVRRHRGPRLGHDRDEPARFVLLDQARLRRISRATPCSTSR